MNKRLNDNFKKNFKNFALWLSTTYVIVNACNNLKDVIKSIKDIDDTPTYLI